MEADFGHLHFAQPLWLCGLFAVPVLLLLYALFCKGSAQTERLKRFADAHLLPHLVKRAGGERKSAKGGLARWSLLWICGMIAMAGPRFGYTDVQTFQPERDLVIVLDLSRSMNAADVKPSRIVRAQQKIDDILRTQKGVTVGLVAYAKVPHMVVPLTDDMRTIENLVPALDTSLITVEGDDLKPALKMAARMLAGEPPGNDKSILVISDGGFGAGDLAGLVRAARGARIYTMGVGTPQGAPVPDGNGGFVDAANGNMLISRLESGKLRALARLGGGIYVHADYTQAATDAVLARVEGLGAVRHGPKTVRIWNARFYIPVLLLALLLLPLFRRGAVFPVVLSLLLLHPSHAHAAAFRNFFFNDAQRGKIAYDAGDYAGAMKDFKTPYRKGVAAYRAKDFPVAATLFKSVRDPKLRLFAQYNAANAELMGGKINAAISDYKAVLKQAPQDARAKHNLAIAEKLLKLRKKQKKKQKKHGKQDKKSENQKSDGATSGRKKSGQQKNSASQKKNQAGSNADKKEQDKTGQSKVKEDPAQEKRMQKEKREQKQKQKPGAAAVRKTEGKKAQKENAVQGKDKEGKDRKPAAQKENTARQTLRHVSQKDIDANQWLDHIRSDPGSFLQNQFRIEERKARAAEEENQ